MVEGVEAGRNASLIDVMNKAAQITSDQTIIQELRLLQRPPQQLEQVLVQLVAFIHNIDPKGITWRDVLGPMRELAANSYITFYSINFGDLKPRQKRCIYTVAGMKNLAAISPLAEKVRQFFIAANRFTKLDQDGSSLY